MQRRKIIRAVASITMAVSIISAGYILIDSIKSNKLNENLSEIHSYILKEVDSEPPNNKQNISINVYPQIEAEPEEIINEDASPDTCEEEICKEKIEMSKATAALYSYNSDTIGWITVPGTKINYPVVQSTDNEFYLHNDFNKEESQPGTIFADYRASVKEYGKHSGVITLYGHNQYDGAMFGQLDRYHNNLDFYKENPVFSFSDLYQTYEYKIVSVFVCKTTDSKLYPGETVFDYQNYINFNNDDYSREKFVENILNYSEIETTVDIQDNDEFVLLSTCSYVYQNARFVVVGRRVRENESNIVDVDAATSKLK